MKAARIEHRLERLNCNTWMMLSKLMVVLFCLVIFPLNAHATNTCCMTGQPGQSPQDACDNGLTKAACFAKPARQGWVDDAVCNASNTCSTKDCVVDCACPGPECDVDFETPVPAVSEWGLIIMTVLALTAGTILFGRRRRAAAA